MARRRREEGDGPRRRRRARPASENIPVLSKRTKHSILSTGVSIAIVYTHGLYGWGVTLS